MFKRFVLLTALISSALLSGCASVPMGSKEQDAVLKTFPAPPTDSAGLYVYRNSFVGQALKKTIYVDGTYVGESANKTFFYKTLPPGNHKISTESEFSNNDLSLDVESGKNYFVRQFIKMGVFVGGAGLELISEAEGKKDILKCKLAK